ncbi:MAG TPA: hypothetical protein VF175_15660 [Lacipirellula sp.]
MSQPDSLEVMIDGQLVQCRSVDDKMRLEPVGGILADGSVEGYRREELDAMVATLERYELAEAAQRLKALLRKQ